MRTQVFSHEQVSAAELRSSLEFPFKLYVALSRVRSIDGLQVLTEPPKSPLLNIVFKEVLQEELALPGASDILACVKPLSGSF